MNFLLGSLLLIGLYGLISWPLYRGLRTALEDMPSPAWRAFARACVASLLFTPGLVFILGGHGGGFVIGPAWAMLLTAPAQKWVAAGLVGMVLCTLLLFLQFAAAELPPEDNDPDQNQRPAGDR